ncbi:MAG: hypothetical protein ACI841_000917, partial [Planctomycetota bacterium]
MSDLLNTNLFATVSTALLIGTALTDTSSAQNPFDAGLRWTHQAPAAEPWIPEGVCFSGSDNLVFAAAKGSPARYMLLDSEGATWQDPRFLDVGLQGAIGSVAVTAGARADRQFTVAQFASPTLYERRTEVTRHDAISAASGGAYAPRWFHDMLVRTNGPARVCSDELGQTVVAAIWLDGDSTVQLDFLEGDSGTLTNRITVNGAALNALAISRDGSRVALTAGIDFYVFDHQGETLFHEILNDATQALSMDATGDTIILGGRAQLGVFSSDRGVYAFSGSLNRPVSDYALRAAVSDDGSTIAVAWWNGVTGVDVTFELWTFPGMRRLQQFVVPGVDGGLQNLPVDVRLTADGQRALFASWGNDNEDPEVLLVDRDRSQPVLEIDLPGSPRSIDLDATGTRVVVGHKDTHANQPSQTGAIRMYDTGERELALVGTPEVGGTLHLAAQHPAQGNIFFLFGPRAAPTIIG